jgi:apolipoprotein N-acyltransferase
LFVAVRLLGPCRAALAGAVWGASLFLFLRWFETPDAPGSWTGLVLLATVPGAYAAFAAGLTRRWGFNPFVLALGWLAVELILQPFGFRHGLLSDAQHDGFLMTAIERTCGYLVLAYLIVLVNGVILSVVGDCRFGSGSTAFRVTVRQSNRWLTFTDTFFRGWQVPNDLQPRAPPVGLV